MTPNRLLYIIVHSYHRKDHSSYSVHFRRVRDGNIYSLTPERAKSLHAYLNCFSPFVCAHSESGHHIYVFAK